MSSTSDTTPLFHVVCHDCAFERLVDSERAARVASNGHESTYDHAIEIGRMPRE